MRSHSAITTLALYPGEGGAWRCVSLGSVYVAARVGAVCLLACVIACGLCEVPVKVGGRPLGEVRAQRLRVRAPVDYLGNCGCG